MKHKGINITQWAGSLKDQQPYYVAVIDAQGEMFFTNSHFYTSFQAAHPKTPNAFFDLVHESDRQQLNATLGALSIDENSVTTQIRIKNGHFRWVKWEISCIQMPETRSEKFLCLGYDVTGEEQQRKTMQAFEQDFQTSNALFTSFMDHTPYFTWIIDEDENLLFANKSLLQYFNLDRTVFGRKLGSLIPGPIARIFQDKHNHSLNSGLQNKSIVKALMADGKEHVYQVTVFPIHSAGPGKMVGGEALDITASYDARQKEKKANQQLLNVTKTTSEGIIRAQEQERTRIGNELHDNVNQILATGQLFLGLLNPEEDNFQEIKERTTNALQLGIEEIRKLSKALVIPDLQKGGLVASIQQVVDDLRFGNLFNIGFTHSQLCDIESISQNKKVTLFRIIQEQTRNIVKYSKANNVKISLDCCCGQIRLLLKDDGAGFDIEKTRRGLGLSNIYERTRLYSGKVVLKTAPGKGCSIIINIPLDPQDLSVG